MRRERVRFVPAVLVAVMLWVNHASCQDVQPVPSSTSDPPVNGGASHDVTVVTTCPGAGCLTSENDCAQGAYGMAEYLLLRPRRRDLDFAIVDPRNNGRPEGPIESLEWDRTSGFRAGGGYRFAGVPYDLGVFYTYLHSHDDRAVSSPADGVLYATLTHPRSVEEVSRIGAEANLDYHIGDIEFGRRIDLADASWVRMFGGGRFAWINQKVRALHDGGDANLDRVFNRIDFEGAGLRAGGEGFWGLGAGFGLVARASAALVLGTMRVNLQESNNVGATTIVNVSDKFDKVVPVTELGLGISWQRRNIRATLGYEIVNWFNLVDSPDFVDDVHRGKMSRRSSDLSLDGLFFQVAVGF